MTLNSQTRITHCCAGPLCLAGLTATAELSELYSNDEDAISLHTSPIVNISQVSGLFGHPWEYKPTLPPAMLCISDMLTAYPTSTEDHECRCRVICMQH